MPGICLTVDYSTCSFPPDWTTPQRRGLRGGSIMALRSNRWGTTASFIALAGALAIGAPAAAQDAAQNAAPAAAPDAADQADTSGQTAPDIVVTAQFREQK